MRRPRPLRPGPLRGDRALGLPEAAVLGVLVSARRVGETRKVYGLDTTEEMLALALENKAKAGSATWSS